MAVAAVTYLLSGSRAQGPRLAGAPDDHFFCYKVRDVAVPRFAAVPGVSVVDQFESTTVDVKKPLGLCTPANKNGEGIVDPATHLEAYKIRSTLRHVPQHVQVDNQFGQLAVDTVKAESLLVPTSKDLASPPALPGPHNVDHYKCYKVKIPKGDPRFAPLQGIGISDQFETKQFDLLKPTRLCVPVDKNGEGIKNPAGLLQCYLARQSRVPAQPPHAPVLGLYVANEFGAGRLDTVKAVDLCVPSLQYPATSTTTTTTTSTTLLPPVVCGDNSAGGDEVCDGTDLRGATCASVGFVGGTLSCVPSCRGYDSTRCSFPAQLPPDPAAVAPVLDRTVATDVFSATAFLYTGATRIQYGVGAGTIEARRAAVLKGTVTARDGTPLPGVQITVLGHPELGGTLSRADGQFDLVVNGGGLLTIRYEKSGFLSSQRQVAVRWQEYVALPDVVMVAYDTAVTAIDLEASTPMQAARGSPVTDADGSRQATLLFSQGTTADLVLPDGSTQRLTGLHVRATEYTVGPTGPAAMPGELPANVAYTYAAEFSADEALAAGAREVRFSQPVIAYVENFLAFPVGGIVPVGYYDREKGTWVASDNGLVIRVLGVTEGRATLDIDGTGVAADPAALASLGVTDAERAQLATLYPSGQSLWRVPLRHFSPWDCNWPFGPPPNASPPPPVPPPPDDGGPCEDAAVGSIIGCQGQTLGERIALVGTGFDLHYQSKRVPGRKAANSLVIPLSGATLPEGLRRIELEVDVGGRHFRQTFSAAPDQTFTFVWDGLDVYGRALQGKQQASVRVGYVYDGVYQQPGSTGRFGRNGNGLLITGIPTRLEVTLWRVATRWIGPWDERAQGLGGWSIDVHHAYDPLGRVLYFGDGRQRNVQDIVISSVAGGGASLAEGIPAVQARLQHLGGIAVAPDGSVFVSNGTYSPGAGGLHNVRRVGADGLIRTVAGTGTPGFEGDGGPATQAQLSDPQGLALGPDGSLYIAERGNHRVRRVGPDGIIATVAGTGVSGFSGDNGPATQAQLASPTDVAVGPDGSLYIADSVNDVVRRVGPDGLIGTIAGNRALQWPESPDGGPATQAALLEPSRLAVGPGGSLYISEGLNCVRRVGPDGRITTVAGVRTIWTGFSGDGGPATEARLNHPAGLAVASDGSVYIVDEFNYRVRRVAPDGIITTISGNGNMGSDGDGGPATQARDAALAIALGPDERVYIAEPVWNRVRRLEAAFEWFGGTGIAIPAEDGGQLYQFDSRGRHLWTRDTITGAVLYTFAYDSAGRLAAVQDGDGDTTTIARDGSGAPTAIVGPYGQRTALTLDPHGSLATLTNPAGEGTQLASTGDGLLTQLTNPRGSVYAFTYDALGRLTRDDDPAGGFTALARTDQATGFTVTKTTATGRVHTFLVERLASGDFHQVHAGCCGQATDAVFGTDGSTTVTAPDGTVTAREAGPDPRWGMGAPVTTSAVVTTPGGLRAELVRTRAVVLGDPADPLSLQTLTDTTTVNGRTVVETVVAGAPTTRTVTTAAQRQLVATLDARGRVQRVALAGLYPVRLDYDAQGRLAVLHHGPDPATAETRTLTLAYQQTAGSDNGYLATLTDAAGRVTRFAYDGAGRVVGQTLPDGRVLTAAYDASGNLTVLTPPGRPAHQFAYTPVQRVAAYTPPGVPGVPVPATQYTYNGDRQVTQVTRPDGQAVTYGYDAAGRLATVTDAAGTRTGTYDPTTGQLTGVGAPGGEDVGLTFDGPLPTGTTWTGPVAGSVGLAYDADLRVGTITVNGAAPVSFGYDADGLLTAAGSLTLTRDPQHGLVTGTALGVVGDSRTYTGFGERATYTATGNGTPRLAMTDTRDPLGRITRRVETLLGSTTTTDYGYDTAGRLATVTQDGTVVAAYTYDANGNRLTRTTPGGTVAGTYDDQDRLLSYGPASYTYTANGELAATTTAGGTTTYGYDALGNLRSVALADGRTIAYVIDGANRRVGKRVNGTLVQGFLWESPLRIAAELDGSGNVVSRFVYGTRVNVPEYLVRGGQTYRLVTDHLGSPRLVINVTDGTIAQRMDYDEFGRVTLDTNPGFQPFGFAGGLYDPDTGLVRFGARDYDPATGRWTAKDPIGFRGGDANLYGYVVNDPINARDPRGLDTLSFGVTITGGVGIGGGGGTMINFGYSAAVGFSFSVTGTAEGGAIAGGAASVQGVFQYTKLGSVCELNGPFVSVGKSGGVALVGGGNVIFDTAGNPVGFSGELGVGYRGSPSFPISTTGFYSDTSSIVSYSSEGGFSGPSH